MKNLLSFHPFQHY